MKLLQLNMWMGRLTRQIVRLIEEENPDIITAQEIFSSDTAIALPDRMFNLFEEIRGLGYLYATLAPCHTMDFAGEHVSFGNATFSKLPITNQKVVFSNGQLQDIRKGTTIIPNVRNALFTSVPYKNGSLHIINHHGYWEPNPIGSQATVEAMARIASEMKKLDGPILLAGDLNVAPDSPALDVFKGWLEDLAKTHAITSTLSGLSVIPDDIACDHIFVDPIIDVLDFTVLDAVASDHKALSLIFE